MVHPGRTRAVKAERTVVRSWAQADQVDRCRTEVVAAEGRR